MGRLYTAWVIALVGCAVSIYFGEILWVEPCRLCWYQRMALFPLALILGMAVYRGDASVVHYLWPFIIFGALIALYQSLAIHYPTLGVCKQGCSEPIFSLFNLFTFPDFSATGFVVIGLLLLKKSNCSG